MQIFESRNCARDDEATVLELHLDWAVMVVQEVFNDLSLLCINSLVLYADEAVGVHAYLRKPPSLMAFTFISTLYAWYRHWTPTL